MNKLDQLKHQIRGYLLVVLLADNLLFLLVLWLCVHQAKLSLGLGMAASLIACSVFALLATFVLSSYILGPVKVLWQTILRLNPEDQHTQAPSLEQLKLGRELVVSLTSQLDQLATMAERSAKQAAEQSADLHNNFIAQNIPLPLIVIDATDNIRYANHAAAEYLILEAGNLIGSNVYNVLDLSFPSEATLDSWLKSVKVKNATATSSWERVRLNPRDNRPVRLFDLAAYYNRGNPQHNETMLVMFDHTKEYSQDDQAVSFLALSVHELRTPLTLLRGYIEVFEEELGETITDPELQSFMLKMHAMAEQLTAYVNNILNVARVDNDQLELKLQSEDWRSILKGSIDMLGLRAKVRGMRLECRIALDLPPVAVDRLSIHEVINNLIDNAIKYSGKSKTIKVEAKLNNEGLVETTVQDFGVGISTSLLPNIFSKFYRDHHNRSQVGGTGLGLYLTKAIVTAHGGTIYARSKEGEGTTFGFTLLPYDKLADKDKTGADQSITKSAQGWIKNHSLYRR